MKRLVRPIILIFAFVFVLASCATKTPTKPVEPQQPTKPTTEPAKPGISQAELDQLLAQAQVEKKKAFDYKIFEILPDDYKAANNAYASAKADYDAAKAPEAKDGLTKTIALFKDLNAKGIVEVSAMRRKEAGDMKAAALKAGADSAFPERFQAGEKSSAAATDAEGGKSYEAAIAAWEKARVLYELAYKRSLAANLKEKAEASSFQNYDPSNFALATTKLADEEKLYAAGTYAPAVDALDEAVLRLNLVVQKGRQSVAMEKKQASDQAKGQSEEIKAQVAVKDEYSAALALYNAGISALAAGDFEQAGEKFVAAEDAFKTAFELAADKKAKAKEAMDAAAAAADTSLQKAKEADSQVGTVVPATESH